MRVFFPIDPVEFLDLDGAWLRFEASHVDIDAIGVGARNIERLDAASLAEQVLGFSAIEGIGSELIFALQ